MRSRIHQNNLGLDGAQTTTNTITNRERNDRCSIKRKTATKMNKSNGHAIPLAQGQRIQKKIIIYWRPGKSNYSEY